MTYPQTIIVGRYLVCNPNLLLTSYTTWNGARVPGTTKAQSLGQAFRELEANDRRTGFSPLAPYFEQLAELKAGGKLSIENPNGYIHHFECS